MFKHRNQLLAEAKEAKVSHWAPNCATYSRAREIPIKGVATPPKPLRDEENPKGIPRELARMSKKARRRLEDDTSMADLSADQCYQAAEDGRVFTLEHPGNSLAKHLPSWKRLTSRPDVREVFYHTCMFEGSRRRKYQVLITNGTSFKGRIGRLREGAVCTRTGQPHLRWRPTVTAGRVVQFQTGDEREYPTGFCEEYAKAAREVIHEEGKFLEVFSGPNAPLSVAVADLFGLSVPGQRLSRSEKGVKNELQHLSQILEADPVLGEKVDPTTSAIWHMSEGYNRDVAIQAGKQPGYGKRQQLIPDGTQDPVRHLEKALRVGHPFNSDTVLKEDHKVVFRRSLTLESEASKARLKTLGEWRALAVSAKVIAKQEQHEKYACDCSKKLGRRPRTALMEYLGQRYGIEDKAVPMLCLTGMPIIGKTLESPFFDPYPVPASVSVKELLATAPARRNKTLGRVKMMAEAGGATLCKAIWDKTMKEVGKGSMAGPFTQQQVETKHGKWYNVVPSFGLEQGEKYRRIDDHSASHNNLASDRTQKIQMAMVDYLMVMIRSTFSTFKETLVIGTEDMAGAYRQVPLPDRQVSIAITAVHHWESGQPRLFEIYGQPFGAAAAVPNFYRLAEWAARLMVRSFNVMLAFLR